MIFSSISINELIYQSLGIIALVFTVFSFQGKNMKRILILQAISGLFWTVHYLLTKAIAPSMLNALCIIRCIVFIFVEDKNKRNTFTIVISLAFVAAGLMSVLMFGDKWFIALLTVVASIVGNIFFCIGNDQKYRIAQLSFISPCWLVNNIYFFSMGGIVCESINIVSVIIALIRLRKKEESK